MTALHPGKGGRIWVDITPRSFIGHGHAPVPTPGFSSQRRRIHATGTPTRTAAHPQFQHPEFTVPADFLIDEQRELVFSRGIGVFTYHDFLEHAKLISGDPRFKPEFAQVVDCRAITSMELTGDQIRELAGRSIFSAKSRRAFVASSDVLFGLSRIFAAYREVKGTPDIRVFRDMREALAWLGLPPESDPYADGQ